MPKKPLRLKDLPSPSSKPFKGICLGIDPSLRGSGFAVLEVLPDRKMIVRDTFTLKIKPKVSQVDCLGMIGSAVEEQLNSYPVKHVAIESTIYVQNMQTAQVMASTRGGCIAVASMRDIPVFEIAPKKMKMQVTSRGDAKKEDVARMLKLVLGVDLSDRLDESDALGLAYCHALTWRG